MADRATTPSVSIAMATYNGMPYLAAQMQTLLDQTSPPIEIVVGDDGSTDGTLEFLTQIALSSDIPVKVIANTTRLGWRANFMRITERCSGDLIAFCDQDDLWELDKLQVVKQQFARDTVVLVVHRARTVDATGTITGDLRVQGPRRASAYEPLEIDLWHCPLGFSMTFHRALLAYNDIWPESFDQLDRSEKAAHDQWFHFLATILGTAIYLDHRLVQYRLHGANAMGHRTTRHSMAEVVDKLRSSMDKLRSREAFLVNRLALVESISESHPDLATRMMAAFEGIMGAKKFTDQRALMYSCANRIRRLYLLGRLIRSGGYSGSILPVGFLEFVRDFLVCVLGTSVRGLHEQQSD